MYANVTTRQYSPQTWVAEAWLQYGQTVVILDRAPVGYTHV